MKWDESWAEVFAVLFIVIGFVVSIILQSAFFSYLSIFLAGFIAGRVYYLKKLKEPIFPFILIMVGFLFGYLIGSVWASRTLTLIFFIIGFGLSYYLHMKNILVSFKSENFIK